MNRLWWTAACFGTGLLLLGGAAGGPAQDKGPGVKFEIRLAQKERADGLEEMAAPKVDYKIYVRKDAAITNADIAEARAVKNALDQPAIEVVFAEGSRKKVGDITGGNIDKIAAVFVDGKLIAAPVIRAKISGKAEITGDFTRDEAERIAKGIRAK